MKSFLQYFHTLQVFITGSLLTGVQQEGIVDPQGVGVLLGVQTDVGETLDSTDISDTTPEHLLHGTDTCNITVSTSEKDPQKVRISILQFFRFYANTAVNTKMCYIYMYSMYFFLLI